MAETNMSGPLVVEAGVGIGEPGQAGSYDTLAKLVTAISDNTATKILTINIPNQNASGALRLLITSTLTAAGHIADSTRVVEYLIPITRVPDSVATAIATVSAAVGAQIATSAVGGARTLTTVVTVDPAVGGPTAVNTIAVNITNVSSVAGISQTLVFAELLSATGAQGLGAALPTGITIS